jgi:putative ABC transport system permease protein
MTHAPTGDISWIAVEHRRLDLLPPPPPPPPPPAPPPEADRSPQVEAAGNEHLFPDHDFAAPRTSRPIEDLVASARNRTRAVVARTPSGPRTLVRLASRGARADKARLGASVAAIVVSVAFMAATQLLTATIGASFHRSVDATYGDAALIIRADGGVRSDLGTARPPIDAALVDAARSVPDVTGVSGRVRSQVAVLDRHGRPIGGTAVGPSITALNWPTDPVLGGWTVLEGTVPSRADEIVMDRHTATGAGFALGDQVTMQTNGGLVRFRLVGLAAYRGNEDFAGSAAVMLNTTTAQKELLRPGSYSWIEIAVRAGARIDDVRGQVAARVGHRAAVVTVAEYAGETQSPFEQLLDALRGVLTMLAAVALVVGAFIIHNTYTIVVAQRARELALLRAIGASTRQSLAAMALEAALTGGLAALTGLALGAGIARLMAPAVAGPGGIGSDAFTNAVAAGNSITIDHLEYPVLTLAGIAMASLAVTVASAWLPAWRACRVPPIDALRSSPVEQSADAVGSRRVGKALLTIGAVLAGVALANRGGLTLGLVGTGAVVAFVGSIVIGPALVEPLAMIGRPFEGRFTARLARRNAVRNPRRTGATASALTIGVALVALFGIVVASVKVTVTHAIDSLIVADLVIDAGTFGQTGMDPSFLAEVQAVPGVGRAAGIELGFATVAGAPTQVIGADMDQLTPFVHLDEARGALGELGPDEVAVDVTTAATKGWKVGSAIPTSLSDPTHGLARTPVRVGAIFDTGGAGDGLGVLMSTSGFNAHFPVQQQTLNQLFVVATDDADPEAVQQSLTELVGARYPTAHVRDLEAYKHAQSGQLDVVLSTIEALVVLAVGIAVLGIGNTLALSVHERAREIGVLRAVGMSRRQVRATVRWESLLFAVQGAVSGLAIGVAVGWAIVSALTIRGSPLVFAAPWALLAATFLASVGAGLLAAQLPAVIAARRRPVDALRV